MDQGAGWRFMGSYGFDQLSAKGGQDTAMGRAKSGGMVCGDLPGTVDN